MMKIEFQTAREAFIFELALAQGESNGYRRAMEVWQTESARKLLEISQIPKPNDLPIHPSMAGDGTMRGEGNNT